MASLSRVRFKNVPTPVQFSKVERRTITHTVNAVGKIKPELEVKISSEASGEIIFLGVRDGDTVKKGQLLVRIKPDIVETQLEQYKAGVDAALTEIESAKTMLEKAKVDFNRVNELFKKNYASKDEFEKAKSAVDQYTAAYQGSLARKQQAQASYKQMQNSATRYYDYFANFWRSNLVIRRKWRKSSWNSADGRNRDYAHCRLKHNEFRC